MKTNFKTLKQGVKMRKKIIQVASTCLLITMLLMVFSGPVTAKEKPRYGGKLRIISGMRNFEPEQWDPIKMVWYTGATFGGGIYQTMVWGDLSKGPRGTKECGFTTPGAIPYPCVTGCLTESWKFEDPLNVVFKIRKGIFFPDKPGVMKSREMTAEDVAFALNRFKFDSNFPSPGSYDFFNKFEVVDRYTVRFKLNFVTATWWIHPLMRWVTGLVYPPELVKAGFKWQNVTGTGPWMIKDYVSGSHISYKRNPVYWEKAIINGKKYKLPFADEYDLLLIKDEMTAIAALQTGKADMMEGVRWEHKETLAKSNPELKRYKFLAGDLQTISLRMDKPPFNDIRVRRAAHMAIDNQGIMDAIHGGEAEMLSWPMKADWPESIYTPLEKQPEIVKKMYGYHPEAAKKLLAQAGYPKGFEIDLMAPANLPTIDDVADLISAYWGGIGIKVKIRKVEYGPFLSRLGEADYETVLRGNGINPPWTAIEDAMSPGYLPTNSAIFNEPEIWKKVLEARKNPNVDEQNRVLKWANNQYILLGGEIALPAPYGNSYVWPHVKNYYGELVRTPWNAAPLYARYWLDKRNK